MEQKDLLPSRSGDEGHEDSSSLALTQRRRAIKAFLISPAGALQEYPQLSDDLINFFSQSVNPHMSDATGEPVKGREKDFERWRAAQAWAKMRLSA